MLHDAVASGEGKTLSLGDLGALADRISDVSHQQGFPLATAYVPAQTIDDGVVCIGGGGGALRRRVDEQREQRVGPGAECDARRARVGTADHGIHARTHLAAVSGHSRCAGERDAADPGSPWVPRTCSSMSRRSRASHAMSASTITAIDTAGVCAASANLTVNGPLNFRAIRSMSAR